MPEPSQNPSIFLPLVESNAAATTAQPSNPAIFIDLKRCIGCNACSLACKQENNIQIGERWNEVYGVEKGTGTVLDIRALPMLCQHCADAPCKNTCDDLGYHAIVRRPDGILYVDAAKCVGCKKCIPTCRYKAMFFNLQTNKAEKCHLCMHRIDAGLAPACVITCLGITREYDSYTNLKARHPNAREMGDGLKILYANMGEEPGNGNGDRPTNGYPNPIPCHD
jgi:tetrathionate reductase subunit B